MSDSAFGRLTSDIGRGVWDVARNAHDDTTNAYWSVLQGQPLPLPGQLTSSDPNTGATAEAAPQGIDGEALAPEAQPSPSPSAFDRVTNHTVVDADYQDISGQKQIEAPGTDSAPTSGDSASAPAEPANPGPVPEV